MPDTLNILQALIGGVFICASIANTNIFKAATIEVGFHHYAELVDPTTFLKMPFNAMINIPYVLVGIYWLLRVRKAKTKLSAQAIYYVEVFAIMAILYGPVQLLRIITQYRLYGILDQWFTLPIFCWAAIWANFVLNLQKSSSMERPAMLLSLLSYFLTIVTPIGFEIALGVHILVALVIGISCQKEFGNASSKKLVVLTILSCAGFVLLKVYDHELAKKHYIFKRVSGHFLSKICDVFQFDLVARFLYEIQHEQIKRKLV